MSQEHPIKAIGQFRPTQPSTPRSSASHRACTVNSQGVTWPKYRPPRLYDDGGDKKPRARLSSRRRRRASFSIKKAAGAAAAAEKPRGARRERLWRYSGISGWREKVRLQQRRRAKKVRERPPLRALYLYFLRRESADSGGVRSVQLWSRFPRETAAAAAAVDLDEARDPDRVFSLGRASSCERERLGFLLGRLDAVGLISQGVGGGRPGSS